MIDPRIDCIIFDCDGVLVDSEPIANRVFAELVRDLGIPFPNEEAVAVFPGTTLAKCIEYVETKYDVKLPEDLGTRYRKASFEAFTRELSPVAGVTELLDSLEVPFCVASNGPFAKMVHNLKIAGLFDFFEGKMFSAYDIGHFKPDPGLFIHAAKDMGYEAHACLVIEDSIHGVIAAHRAGMQCIAYTANVPLKQEELERKVPEVKEISQIISFLV